MGIPEIHPDGITFLVFVELLPDSSQRKEHYFLLGDMHPETLAFLRRLEALQPGFKDDDPLPTP